MTTVTTINIDKPVAMKRNWHWMVFWREGDSWMPDEATARRCAVSADLEAGLAAMLHYAAREVGVPLDECNGEPFKSARAALAAAKVGAANA